MRPSDHGLRGPHGLTRETHDRLVRLASAAFGQGARVCVFKRGREAIVRVEIPGSMACVLVRGRMSTAHAASLAAHRMTDKIRERSPWLFA